MWFSFSGEPRSALALIHKSLTESTAIKFVGNGKTKISSYWKDDRVYPWVWLFPPPGIPGKKTKLKGENIIKEKKEGEDARTLDSSITLHGLYFAQFHSVSFSFSVLMLNPVATSEASTWKKQNKAKPKCPERQQSEVHAHQMLLTAIAQALLYSPWNESSLSTRWKTVSVCCLPSPTSFLI